VTQGGVVLCVDVGSTFTKAGLVDLVDGRLLATADHPTTLTTDVLDGLDACREELARRDARATGAEVLACSSAGGGLRIAVVGNEELVTAEAGRRVALSSGGKVVAVVPAATTPDVGAAVLAADPDVVLLTGGTDGGNAEAVVAAAGALGAWDGPVVVAANADAGDAVAAALGGRPHVVTANVVPRVGELAPGPARQAIREMFLAHVIGGKHLSRRVDRAGRSFAELVRGATPDVVLAGVELLARGLDPDRPGVGDVVVVDVGGATTDVHAVVEVDPTAAGEHGLAREVVAPVPVARTVEADLGMRWSAPTTVEAGIGAGLLPDDPALHEPARRRAADPGFLDAAAGEAAYDVRLAAVAAGVAVRRHAGRARVVLGPGGRVVERTGTDLREVDLVVGSGGVLRHAGPEAAVQVLAAVTGPVEGGWQLPERARVCVDRDYVLAAAGLLRERHPGAAYRLVRRLAAS